MRRGLRRRLGASAATAGLALLLAAPAVPAAAPLEALSINPAWVQRNTAPASAPAIIRGIGFTATTTVTFDGVAASVTFVDSRTLQVLVPTSTTGKSATVSVSDGSASDTIFPFMYSDSVVYVKPTGNDASNGSTPALAKKTIQGAFAEITRTGFPGTFPEIRLAAGTYNESGLGMLTGVIMSGGWDTNFTQRSPDQFVAVIDGGRANFVLRSTGIDVRTVVDGVTVRNGLRDGLGGGGFIISSDNAVLSNSVYVGNTSSARGGGIYATFTTSYGGRPTISNNVMLGNRSFSAIGGGIGIYPLYTQGRLIDLSISDNYIVGNRSFGNRGGGLGMGTSASYAYNIMKLAVVGNVIGGNRALSGGGVSVTPLAGSDRVELVFDNNVVFGNGAAGDGGGLQVAGVGHIAGRISGSTFAQNTAGMEGGGGIRFMPSVTYEPGFEATNLIVWGNTNGNLSGSSLATYSDVQGGSPGAGNISLDPKFRAGPLGRFYLQQDPNGMSPAVNSGSGTATDQSQESQTTDAALIPDSGLVDMGYHYPVGAAASPDPISIGRLDPQEGDFGGSDWVLIRGKGFDPGAAVTFDGIAATDQLYISSSRLLAQPAPHAMGQVNVTVTNPDATSATLTNGYRFADNLPPDWPTTVGLQQALTKQDCVRSVVLTWNPAVDVGAPPVRYEIHREECIPTVNDFRNPCTNTGYFATAANRVTTTEDPFYVDTAFGGGGADPKYIYMVRALDSATPVPNNEFNYGKRIALVGKTTGDLTPPSTVGETLEVPTVGLLDWSGALGANQYRVYRQTTASAYATPATLTPVTTLTTANNDLDANGVTDTRWADATTPGPGGFLFYKITALDPCGNETRAELGP